MSTTPNPADEIAEYYQLLVKTKQRADLPLADAKRVATAQIHHDAKTAKIGEGKFDREAVVEFLILRHIEEGGTRASGERHIRADFPIQAETQAS